MIFKIMIMIIIIIVMLIIIMIIPVSNSTGLAINGVECMEC